MEADIAGNPEGGDVMPGSGGMRKARFSYGDGGKRGGGRVIYVPLIEDDVTYMILTYPKVDQEDVPPEVLKQLKALMKELIG